MDAPASILERLIGRQRPLWVTVGVSLLLLLAPIVATYLDGMWSEVLSGGAWRPLLLPPAVIIYILVVAPIMVRSYAEVIRAFRPLVLIDDDRFTRVVQEASRVSPIGEVLSFILGAAFGGVVSQTWQIGSDVFWLRLYVPVFLSLMYGLLGWTIYGAVASTRRITALHRQPLEIDILDTKPFEPIGRQSLAISLVFIGGITLGLVFELNVENIYLWQTWLISAPLAVVAVLVFFLNMRHTHRVLAAEKKRELAVVEQRIRLARQAMRQRLAADESLGAIAAEFNALVSYEARLRAAPTWPHNISMLRTLLFSTLIHLLGRAISALLELDF
jgi:hypothetical protein